MAKPEWGTKRICPHCGVRFYDMSRDPITCPACSTTIDPVVQSRPRRARAAPKLAAAAAVVDVVRPAVVEPDDEVEAEIEDDEEVVVAADDDDEEDSEEDGESAIEDVSELGDDDIDVIETDLEEDEAER